MNSQGLALIALLVHAGCAREEYRNADLQLDIRAIQPAIADRVRLCVEGVRTRTVGAGGGRYAVTGLPMGQPAVVAVDVLVEAQGGTTDDRGLEELITVASTGWVSMSASQTWLEAELELYAESEQAAQDCADCPQPCTTSTNAAETEEESWLLAARFLD